jgi:excisionase family DNA binding protein
MTTQRIQRTERSKGFELSSDQLLFTTEEAAEVLRVGRTTVYALIKSGELRPVHIGRACRISRGELDRYVARLDSMWASSSMAITPSLVGPACTEEESGSGPPQNAA